MKINLFQLFHYTHKPHVPMSAHAHLHPSITAFSLFPSEKKENTVHPTTLREWQDLQKTVITFLSPLSSSKSEAVVQQSSTFLYWLFGRWGGKHQLLLLMQN